MATLVLSTIGAVVAGPIGSAIGAIVGQQIDQRLFAPKGRKGPRLGELAVQTSSYGSAIPKIFGTMRAAGTIIWATDLKEDRHKSGGGKGRPKTTSYSYSASFAVLLSARPIRAVRRIWADGKLLRGAGGDFKTETGFRLYIGEEEQEPDPLIASIEGSGQCPAYRGLAYAVFEDFQLADYGNRIPSLTFEIEADAADPSIGAIAAELSEGAVADGGTLALAGYAASGDSVRAAIEALADVVPLSLADEDSVLLLRMASASAIDIPAEEEGVRGPGDAGGPSEIARNGAGAPGEVAITYHDRARDYQTGLQRAVRGSAGERTDARAIPAALDAHRAKAIAEQRLAALWAARATARVHLPWRWSGARPGSGVRLAWAGGTWRIAQWTLDRMVTTLELVRERAGPIASAAATAGRAVSEPDLAHGPTTIRPFELPPLSEPPSERPILFVAAAGVERGWRRAALTASYDGGGSWEQVGPTAAPVIIGTALGALGVSGSALFDRVNHLDVELLNDDMWIEGRDEAALVAGANLALLGRELIQFGKAEPLGAGRFRLSRLLRGRRATEWAAAGHAAGEAFVLIEAETLAQIEPPTSSGAEVRVLAVGVGDPPAGSEAAIVLRGDGLRPPSPVHLKAREDVDGGVTIRWTRRSRLGWTWSSGGDAPLGEEAERYRIELSAGGLTRAVESAEARLVYTAAERAAHGGEPIELSVAQLGTHGASRAATLIIA